MNRNYSLASHRQFPAGVVGRILACSALIAAFSSSAFADKLVGWEINGQSGYGTSPLPPTSTNPAVTVGGLTRGSGVTLLNSAAANAWGGNGWDGSTTAATAVTNNDFATFTITPTGTFPVALQTIEAYNIRRSASGPATGQWQYQIGGGTFADIGSPITWGTNTAAAGNLQDAIDLTGIAPLQSVPPGTTVTFRIANFNATGSGGNWYINQFQSGDDLVISGTVNPGGGDTIPPAATALVPADNATDLTTEAIENLVMTFSEAVSPLTGTILLKKASDNSTVQSFSIAGGDVGVVGTDATLFLNPGVLVRGESYYVIVPAGSFEDAAGNDFPGITTPTGWNFSIAPVPANPTVVVNKYSNATPDVVELLVVGNQTPGTTVDMRGMIIKDFSTSSGGDNGGKFEFSQDSLWSAVPVGTLVVLSNDTDSSDITVGGGDFSIHVGLDNTTYFTDLAPSFSFEIASDEMVLIKAAGSGAAGTTGGIHGLAGGALGSYYINYIGAKTASASGGGAGVVVTNSTSTIADYVSGTDAVGGITLFPADFGVANNGTNSAFISILRGEVPSNGDGKALVLNVTPVTLPATNPFLNSEIFDTAQSAQSAKVVLKAFVPGVTLTNVSIQVPSALGIPTTGTVSLSGAGAAGATVGVSGQTITVSSAAVTTANALEVIVANLSTPIPANVSANGNYPFLVSTSGSGGSLTPLDTQPAAHVIIPISSVRDQDANGVPLDLGTVVAVEGVVTEGDFSSGTANSAGLVNYSGFLQDATGGINIFSAPATVNPGLVRGNRFAVVGTLAQFNGLTEIIPTTTANVVNLGASTEPAPVVVNLATLFLDPEAYEGKLITVQGLSYVSGTWATANTLVFQDSTPTPIDIRIQAGSSATTVPSTFPVNITGIFGQFDGSSPFTTGYQLMPRTNADVVAGTTPTGSYSTWATSKGISGEPATGDFDKDGLTNLVEYALGLDPKVSSGNPGTLTGGTLSFTKGTEAIANGDVDWVIQTSPDLSAWTTVTPTTEAGSTITYAIPSGLGKTFARLTVVTVP